MLFLLSNFAWMFSMVTVTLAAPSDVRHQGPTRRPSPAPLTMTRLDQGRVQVGTVIADTNTRTVRVPGIVNDPAALEFIANTPTSVKKYESVLTLDTGAAELNAALLLIGLDADRDPRDPVEVFVEWQEGTTVRRVRAEELLWNIDRQATFAAGGWIYKGASFVRGTFLSETDGVLMGFVNSTATLIDRAVSGGLGAYGNIVFNTRLGLLPGVAVTFVVQAPARQPRI